MKLCDDPSDIKSHLTHWTKMQQRKFHRCRKKVALMSAIKEKSGLEASFQSSFFLFTPLRHFASELNNPCWAAEKKPKGELAENFEGALKGPGGGWRPDVLACRSGLKEHRSSCIPTVGLSEYMDCKHFLQWLFPASPPLTSLFLWVQRYIPI